MIGTMKIARPLDEGRMLFENSMIEASFNLRGRSFRRSLATSRSPLATVF
jgi:hypothetical protein